MQSLRSTARRIVTALAAAGAAALVANCAALADIEEFESATTDAAALVPTGPPTSTGTPGGCDGFMCGETCARLGDPAFGCGPANACRACPTSPTVGSRCDGDRCVNECIAPFLDCNATFADGCEVDPRSDSKNCGGCAKACTTPELPDCYEGTCVIPCDEPTTYCGTGCVDVTSSTDHCGKCGNRCPTPPQAGASVSCTSGACTLKCPSGFGDCNGDLVDGCETNIRGTDVAHCGSCAPCPTVPNATFTCNSGSCRIACAAGFANCDGQNSDGCECNLANNNCAQFGNQCVGPCAAVGAACTQDRDCCGATAGTHYCMLDGDGYPVTCAVKP